MFANAILSALLNVFVFAGLPFLYYFAYQKRRRNLKFVEVLRRAGLQIGEVRYIGYSLGLALAVVVPMVIWPPTLEFFLREGSPQKEFEGLGFAGLSVVLALIYGVVKTGFAEEFLFRGLIAGSLSRRFSLFWACLLQAGIFLIPHIFILLIMPEMWWILPIILVGAFIAGWIRIRSGSIIGPWLIHASANVTMCLSIAIRTAG